VKSNAGTQQIKEHVMDYKMGDILAFVGLISNFVIVYFLWIMT
jgi:hypothetical protein